MTYPDNENTRPPEIINEHHETINELNMHELLQLHYDLICEHDRILAENELRLRETSILLEIVRNRLNSEFWQD